jgi:hypothetical protein
MDQDEHDWLAERFEAHRGHLRAVATGNRDSGLLRYPV